MPVSLGFAWNLRATIVGSLGRLADMFQPEF